MSSNCSPVSSQMPHNINFREKKSKVKKDKKAEGQAGPSEEGPAVVKGRVARFRYFEDISGYSGVRGSLPTGLYLHHG